MVKDRNGREGDGGWWGDWDRMDGWMMDEWERRQEDRKKKKKKREKENKGKGMRGGM